MAEGVAKLKVACAQYNGWRATKKFAHANADDKNKEALLSAQIKSAVTSPSNATGNVTAANATQHAEPNEVTRTAARRSVTALALRCPLSRSSRRSMRSAARPRLRSSSALCASSSSRRRRVALRNAVQHSRLRALTSAAAAEAQAEAAAEEPQGLHQAGEAAGRADQEAACQGPARCRVRAVRHDPARVGGR